MVRAMSTGAIVRIVVVMVRPIPGIVPGIIPRIVPRAIPGIIVGIIGRIPRIVEPRIVPREADTPSPARERQRIGGTGPAIVPGVVVHGSAPRAEHRCHILRLYPHLIAHDHHVVEGRIVGRGILKAGAVTCIRVARRHVIRGIVQGSQTTCIGTLIIIGQHRLEILAIRGAVVILLCLIGLRLSQASLPLGTLRLGLSLAGLGFRLLTLSDLGSIVRAIQIVRSPVGRSQKRGRATHYRECQKRNHHLFDHLLHSACFCVQHSELFKNVTNIIPILVL